MNQYKNISIDNLLLVSEYENIVAGLLPYSEERIKELIKKIDKKYGQDLILAYSFYRPFNFKELGDIMSFFGTYQPLALFGQFSSYLIQRKIILIDNFSPDPELVKKCENPIRENDVTFYIKNDDVQGLTKFAVDNEIDLFHWNFQLLFLYFNSSLSFSAFCGSMNVFKYLFLNELTITDQVKNHAINGGNENIVTFIESQGFSYDQQFMTAIRCHQNHIAKWIDEFYPSHDVAYLPEVVNTYNTEMFLYLLIEKNRDINEMHPIIQKNILFYASSQNNQILIEFINKLKEVQ